jgi:hypothetical protein
MQLSLKKGFSNGFEFILNYTLSKSLDHSSTPERQEIAGGFSPGSAGYSGTTINAWEPDLEYSHSDFDMRHQFNAHWNIELPFGRGKRWGSRSHNVVDQIFGGWRIAGIVRINSGLPANIVNARTWPTNWNLQGNATCAPAGAYSLGLATGPCPATQNARSAAGSGEPNLFADPAAALAMFRFTEPGRRGQRNVLRGDKYFNMDLGLMKDFRMPWEGHSLSFRWDAFNLTNSAYFDTASLTTNITQSGTFGNYSAALGGPRRMQLTLRYNF